MLGLSEVENVFDILPVFAVMILMPLLVMVSPAMAINQLTVYRVQHYDLQESRFGCRQSLMNLESVSVSQIKDSFAKKCVIFKINDLMDKMETFQTIIDETLSAGILIIIPKSVKYLNGLSGQQLDTILALERSLVSKEIQIPIYITHETKQLLNIYETQSKRSETVSEEESHKSNVKKLYDSVMANGYQMVVSGPQTSPVKDLIITNIQGKLIGAGVEDQMPTIALVAHYDAFGVAPSLSFGADSNGSGVVVLLELMRLFSKLYSNPKTQPKVNLLFVMSGAGKFNYFGTKKWIENQMDSDNSLLSECLFTICIDSLADSDANNGLFMHVSKPPKDGSPADKLFNDLKQIASKSMPQSFNFSMIHKKINLAEESLAWEHERFSIRRLFAFTLSSLSSHKSLRRKSLTDVFDDKLLEPLYLNTKLISEALSRQLYKNIEFDLFDNELKVSKQLMRSLLFQISSQSRAQQLVRSTQKGSQIETSSLVKTLEQMMRRMVTDVELIHLKVDPKQNELIFYEPTEAVLNIYDVKPAIFDLFVSVAIATYLLIFFAILTNFHLISSLTKRFVTSNDYNSRF